MLDRDHSDFAELQRQMARRLDGQPQRYWGAAPLALVAAALGLVLVGWLFAQLFSAALPALIALAGALS